MNSETTTPAIVSRQLSVVIPVYNSASSLILPVERLNQVLKSSSRMHEIILVNDGSRDESREVIAQLCHRFSYVRGIDLMRNYGQHNALLARKRSVCTFSVTQTMPNPFDSLKRKDSAWSTYGSH